MTDAELSQELASIGLSVATAPLVALVPLVQVAWVDGAVQPEERRFILDIARRRGLADAAGSAILERWLSSRPSAQFVTASHRLVQVLAERTEAPRLDKALLAEIPGWCGGVAEASGGMFGYGRVSPAEKSLLDQLALEAADPVRADGTREGWEVVATATGPTDVALWSRAIPGAPLRAFRGATSVRGSIATAIGFLLDIGQMKDWLFRCDEARLLAHDTPGEWLGYLAIHGIWPVQDRDAVIRVRAERNPSEVVLVCSAAPDRLPVHPGRVRIPTLDSTWRLTPAETGFVRLDWTAHLDPVGDAPAWLVNMATVQAPRFALRRVQDLLPQATAAHTRAGEEWLEGA